MALIICPECGKEISDKANSCPHCGYPLSKELPRQDSEANKYSPNGYSYVDNESSYNHHNSNIKYASNKNQSVIQPPVGKKRNKIFIIIAIILFFSLIGGCTAFTAMMASIQETESSTEKETSDSEEENTDAILDDTAKTNNTVKNKEATNDTDENDSTEIPEQEINIDALPEDEYMANCIELWHDDIFFSENNLEGQYVKLDLFVEEERFLKAEALYGLPITELIENYDLQRTFFFCGVQRKDEYSYMGGQINLFLSDQYGYSSSDINEGDHLVVYGKIIDYSTNTTDGYNACSVLPRFIENNGK